MKFWSDSVSRSEYAEKHLGKESLEFHYTSNVKLFLPSSLPYHWYQRYYSIVPSTWYCTEPGILQKYLKYSYWLSCTLSVEDTFNLWPPLKQWDVNKWPLLVFWNFLLRCLHESDKSLCSPVRMWEHLPSEPVRVKHLWRSGSHFRYLVWNSGLSNSFSPAELFCYSGNPK